MARIRTVKPECFRHELLQDLERDYPTLKPMLVFIGLFGHCDKSGRFPWKPRTLKLDILPFLEFDMQEALQLLEAHSLIKPYQVDGESYGYIPTFEDHQRINGKEAQEPHKYPAPPDVIDVKHEGSNGEALGKHPVAQEGKGREGKGREVPPPGRHDELCTLLQRLVTENNPREILTAAQVEGWRDDAEKLLRLDKRDFEEAKKLITWSQADSFWKKNIRSMGKFREKYSRLWADSQPVTKGGPSQPKPGYHEIYQAPKTQGQEVSAEKAAENAKKIKDMLSGIGKKVHTGG